MFGSKVRKIILGDKSSRFRIVVSALQIVQTRFRVVIVASVSNRVDRCDTADIRDNLMIAPCVVDVLCLQVARRVVNVRDIAHEVATVEVERTAVLEADHAGCTVDEIDLSAATRLTDQVAVDISICDTVFRSTDTVCIIGETIATEGAQSRAIFKGTGRTEIGRRASVCIIYNRLAVKLGQLIGTVGIAVAVYTLRSVRQFVGGRKRICVLMLSENITAVVVFKGRGKVQLSVVLTNQTIQVVVGITNLKSAEFVL